MGQQQLLLIALGVIVVGIAVWVGTIIFNAQSVEQKREILISEAMAITELTQKYYFTPKEFAGGGNSFEGWEIPERLKNTPSSNFEITAINGDEITITGKSNTVVVGDQEVEISILIQPKDFNLTIIK